MSAKPRFHNLPPARVISVALAIVGLAIVALVAHSSAVYGSAQPDREDLKPGQDLFRRRCGSCHSLDSEKQGPRLRGVFGRKAGSLATFSYSDALKKANITWDATLLDRWLTDTDKLIPDNDMNISLKNADERADIISYLKGLSGQ
jgi:cytochrome c